jgi:hypothetical protein
MPDINKTLPENKTEKIINPEKNPENILSPEISPEKAEEIQKEKETVLHEIEKFDMGSDSVGTTLISQDEKNKRKKQIEIILEEDLEEVYLKMPEHKQKEFRMAGEKTVMEINAMLDSAKINIKKIIELIRKWLSIIPGVNRFFVEQEAKIKTDEILKLES